MDINQVAEMCKALDAHASVTMTITEEGKIGRPHVIVFNAKRKDILAYRKLHKLPDIAKKYYNWIEDIDWEMANVKFNKVETCRIKAYKTVHHEAKEAYDEQKPIYECTNHK